MFYFIPPRQEADAGVNAGDLVLLRLETKPKRRQFEIGARGAWRASSGISITHQIQLFRSEAKPGIYTITPALELGEGEYALYLARGEGMQAYVYDFSVSSSCCALTRPVEAANFSHGTFPVARDVDTCLRSHSGLHATAACCALIKLRTASVSCRSASSAIIITSNNT